MPYQYITQYDSPNYFSPIQCLSRYGMNRQITGITVHWWGLPENKPSFQGVVDYLCRDNGNTSAHEVIEAGKVACIVDHKNAAWHSGSSQGNAKTLGLELNPRASDEDYETAGERIADLWRTYGKVPLYRHSDWKNTRCPGNYDLARLKRIAEKYYAQVPPKPDPVEDEVPDLKYTRRNEDIPLTKGEWRRIPIDDKNNVSLAGANQIINGVVNLTITGLPAGRELQIRAYKDNVKDGKTTRLGSFEIGEIIGSAGGSFGQYVVNGDTGADERIRVEVAAFDEGVKITQATTRSLIWKK